MDTEYIDHWYESVKSFKKKLSLKLHGGHVVTLTYLPLDKMKFFCS